LPSDWPFHEASRFLEVDGIRWHYQQVGAGPALLLVHGTGGATSSWHHCLAALARSYAVTAIDLPGHGFTRVPAAVDTRNDVYSLGGMARAVSSLLRAIGVEPVVVAGHSAGVAVLVRMTLDGLIAPSRIVGFNPALVAPPDWYVSLVAPMLASVFESRALADGGAWLARSTGIIRQMLTSTGTTLSPADLARYEYLCRMPSHVHAALAMMSRWDLPRIVRDAVGLAVPLELYAGANDRWVPLAALSKSVARIPAAVLTRIDGAGHLLLEERPDAVVGALT
jgi:magnesium chelatase accessory protein